MKINVPIGQFELLQIDNKQVLKNHNSEVVTDIELVRLVARQALDVWWSQLAVDVSEVGLLPMESVFNSHSFGSASILDSEAVLIDIADKTLIVPAAKVREKLREFNADLKAHCDAWDRTLAAIEAATTIEAILAVRPSSPAITLARFEQGKSERESRERHRRP